MCVFVVHFGTVCPTEHDSGSTTLPEMSFSFKDAGQRILYPPLLGSKPLFFIEKNEDHSFEHIFFVLIYF